MKENTLKEVCELAGVTRRAVQGFEKAGLVTAAGKNKYGHLLYDDTAVEKVKEIKQYQDFGFTVKEIKVLLTASKEEYLKMMEERLAAMQTELEKLQADIERACEEISCKIYEVKYSKEQVPEQYRHLNDEQKCAMTSHRYGDIADKYVIY